MEELQTRKTVKILHFGDVFLDCPFPAMEAEVSAARRRETRETFLRVIRYAAEQNIDLALITGNLIDNHYATLETLELLTRAFTAVPKCRFVICPGSHDAITENSLWRVGNLPENVYVFDSVTPVRHAIPDIGCAVTGWAFTGDTYPGSPLAGNRAEPYENGFSLVAGYATNGGDEGEAPVSINQIGEFGGDYTALSGGNLFDGFHRVNTTVYGYSGSLENACYEEPGFGGANLITVTPGQNGQAPRVETARLDFGCRRYAMEEFDITGIESPNEVLNRITEVIRERGYGKETALRVILTGRVPVGFAVPNTMTNENFGLYVFELLDRTMPAFDESRVARDMTVRGELCRTLIPQMRDGTEEVRRAAARAMKVGLAALDNRDITKL